MKAVVWHDVGDISLDDVPDPTLDEPTDAIVRITASAICGTDLHFVRGSMPGMRPVRGGLPQRRDSHLCGRHPVPEEKRGADVTAGRPQVS